MQACQQLKDMCQPSHESAGDHSIPQLNCTNNSQLTTPTTTHNHNHNHNHSNSNSNSNNNNNNNTNNTNTNTNTTRGWTWHVLNILASIRVVVVLHTQLPPIEDVCRIVSILGSIRGTKTVRISWFSLHQHGVFSIFTHHQHQRVNPARYSAKKNDD